MKSVYVLVWEDKHCDTEVKVFDKFFNAMAYARKGIKEAYLDNDVEVEYPYNNEMQKYNWMFFAYAEDLFNMRIEKVKIQ